MSDPLVVDLGFGSAQHTTLELADRITAVKPTARVVGIEIDPARVAAAKPFETDVVSFRHGGFEIPTDRNPDIIRAFNVLRQYEEPEVAGIWETVCSHLAPGGIFIDGTCDEIGRVSTWVALSPTGPETFSVSLRLADLESPSIAAERLIKALIHRNVNGENIHRFFVELDRHWATNAGIGALSPIQRWVATVRGMKAAGWPVHDNPSRWRLGEITVDWAAIAPRQ
ncbi:MAG: class I SAM-dependent methyltransferase [Microbacteriaceae bacterium]